MADALQKQLLQIVHEVNNQGKNYSTGELPPTPPGLMVEGLGLVSVPLVKAQATALKKLARQAPYGKGTKTLVDTNVRRVWEIDAAQLSFANPKWQNVLNQALTTAQAELGLGEETLEAHLYKLLIYEKGSFFLPHRDGEKIDRMVATMIVALPSEHTGGALVIRHEGAEVTVDFSEKSAFGTQFAAFYADCEHEVRPVQSGIRLALVYNLTLASRKKTVKPPSIGQQAAEAAEILSKWKNKCLKASVKTVADLQLKLAVLLDHKYTQAGIEIDALKGQDRARADMLFTAAAAAGCDCVLALATYWVSGSAEPNGDDYYSRGRVGWGRDRYRGYSDFDDEDDEDDDDSGDDDEAGEHEMGEVFDYSLHAEHFSDARGQKLAFGEIPIEEVEIVSKQPISTGKPDQEEFEGDTGNAGMTLERWYHRAAVLIWPKEVRFQVLSSGHVANSVGGLQMMMADQAVAPKVKQKEMLAECKRFASQVMQNWPEEKHAGHGDFNIIGPVRGGLAKPGSAPREIPGKNHSQAVLLLEILAGMDDADFISEWLLRILARDKTVNPGRLLGQVLQNHGWATLQKPLEAVFAGTGLESFERHAWLLADWATLGGKKTDRTEVCAELAWLYLQKLIDWKPAAGIDYSARKFNPAAFLPPLALALISLNQAELLDRLVALIQNNPARFDLVQVQVPTLLSLEEWLKTNLKKPVAPLGRWLGQVVAELQSRKENRPVEPTDFRRKGDTGCRCDDCKTLSRFLANPDEETLLMPLAKERRRHLHEKVDRNKLDTTHVTQRVGSPHKLLFTKTINSHLAAMKAYNEGLAHLKNMQRMLTWHESLG